MTTETDENMLTALLGIRALLYLVGDDPDREGLRDTPSRVVRALQDHCNTNGTTPEAILGTVFTEAVDEMVVVGPVSFSSLCEHHLLPMHGTATIAYIPRDGRVVGLSKLPRLLDHFASRLQVQERLTAQVAEAIQSVLDPLGVAVVLRGTHTCLSTRGARKREALMTTSVMNGYFRDLPAARAEVLDLARAT